MLTLILASMLTLPPQKSDAVIGVAAMHIESGRRLTLRENERFPMGSDYKFPIGIAILHRVDKGELALNKKITIEPKDFAAGFSPLRDNADGKPITLTIGELLRHMVSISDNTASDTLLRLAGGPHAVSERMAQLGVGGIRIDRSETQIAADLRKPNGVANYAIDVRDTATPADMAALLFALWRGRDGLTAASHDLLFKLMSESTTGARRIKAVVPSGSIVTHKTGTMPGTANDAAIVTSADEKNHVVIVIFTKQGASELEVREDDIAAVARKVWEELAR